MSDIIREINFNKNNFNNTGRFEWLITNGLGGYSSGTIGGAVSRRYHGLLISSLQAPLGRMVMFNHLVEKIQLSDGRLVVLGIEEFSENRADLPDNGYLVKFRLEWGLPVWTYEVDGVILEKRLIMPYMQNTIFILYKVIKGSGRTVRLELHPSFQFRPHEADVNTDFDIPYELVIRGDKYEIKGDPLIPNLKFKIFNKEAAFTVHSGVLKEIFYQSEADRGYYSKGKLWNPGYFRSYITERQDAVLVASTETWETIMALRPDELEFAEKSRRKRILESANLKNSGNVAAELILASDQFIISPVGRTEDVARARASGDEVRSIIAGYHWFTDWGRDTMISLEGLTLVTGRYNEARWILRTFAYYVKYGLIPNMFPEGEKEGLYHTADATLWFFHAIKKYVDYTKDISTLKSLLPVLEDIIHQQVRGTLFGIKVDEEDGLLKQGEEGYQLTWMDAKVDDWVVTPRRGKAVEINALWYNALCLMENWVRKFKDDQSSKFYSEYASRAREAFNKKFWYEKGSYLYDVVDGEKGDDNACRPNQIFAFSMENPVLNQDKWKSVLDKVTKELLTPVGLRSLAPGHPDYKAKYFGNLRARDAAYHQGTVWSWLIGPYIDAYLKVYPDKKKDIAGLLSGFEPHLNEACIGTISEIFDAEEPYTPRGCAAQAWSVAEVLRCYKVTEE